MINGNTKSLSSVSLLILKSNPWSDPVRPRLKSDI